MDISWLVSATSRLKKGATDKMDGIDMGTPLIEIKHLKKYFRTQRGMLHAVDDISFSIPEGETPDAENPLSEELCCGCLNQPMERCSTKGKTYWNAIKSR